MTLEFIKCAHCTAAYFVFTTMSIRVNNLLKSVGLCNLHTFCRLSAYCIVHKKEKNIFHINDMITRKDIIT